MPRVLRTRLPDGLFHVTTSAVANTPAFFSDLDRVEFLRLCAECARGYEWSAYAYCLMTTHYHLVVEARQEQLSLGMQRLNGVYAQRVNRRLRRRGHLFGARYTSRVVEGDEHARAVCRYVLLNPVRAGLCGRAQDWPWSDSRYGKSL